MTGDDDEVAFLESGGGLDEVAVDDGGEDGEAFHDTVSGHAVGEELVAVVDQGAFTEEEGIGLGGGYDFDIDVHAGHEGADVLEVDGDFDGAGFGFDDGGDTLDGALVFAAGEGGGSDAGGLADLEAWEFAFGDVDPGDDGVEVDEVEEVLVDIDEVAGFDHAAGDGAWDGGSDLGIFEFALGVFEGEFILAELVLDIGEGLFADEVLVEEGFGAGEFCAGFFEVALGFLEERLLDVVFQLDEDLVFGDEVAFFDEEFCDAVGGAGEDFDFGFRFEVGGGADDGLDGAAGDGCDFDRDGGRGFVVLVLVLFGERVFGAPAEEEEGCQGEEREGWFWHHRYGPLGASAIEGD
ncbi:MAG: hypothetical protein RI897_2485 [Verrucomicrobiota bacterium]